MIDPDMLSDGRLVHHECKKRLTHEVPRPRASDDAALPSSVTRLKAAVRRRSGSTG